MAELRHSSSLGGRATPSPRKRDDVTSPLSSSSDAHLSHDDDGGRDRHPRDRFRSLFSNHFQLLDETARNNFKIFMFFVTLLAFAGLYSVYSVISHLNAPYLCTKDGITLHCPRVKETPSLWENPLSATTSWKSCAERRVGAISDLPEANETNGYIFIHAEGGLNQQRIAICNAVAVAKIMNATLILPVLKQDQIWKDQTKFEDIFDVDHFIDYLKDDVQIVRDIPSWFTDKSELFTSIRRTVKNIPKYAPAQFYIDNVLPRIKEKKIMALKPFVDRLGYDNVPQEINRLRCRVNYHALKFLPEIDEMANRLVERMRNRTDSPKPFMALHLRFEKGMVGLSFCDFVGTRAEKALMGLYRLKEWPRRFKDGSHLWPLALQKRKEGRCPLEPGEVAVMLRAMGYPKETQIYVASGQVYGGQNRMPPLRNMFPNLGINRAFGFVSNNEADDVVESQTPMLFQLAHSKNFNVGVQALMLIFKISSKNQIVSDRFYRALYSKLLLPSAMNISNEMFIGLLTQAMKDDPNLKRVAAFAKRLLQVSLQQQPQYTSACIFLLSEVLKSKPPLWNMVLQNELADEELEHFEDVVEEPDTEANKTADKPENDGVDDDDPSEDEAGSPVPSSDDEFSDKGDDDLLGFNSLTNLDDSQKASGHAVKIVKSSLPGGYDPRHREPIYCNADRVGWWELMVLASHVHPSVSTMAKTLLSGANIVYNGNPLIDLSLGTFLDKFMEKKPKARNWHGGSQIEPVKQLDMSKQLIGAEIIQLDEMDVAPEDVVFHKFFMNKMNASKKPKKKKKGADEEAVEDFMGDDDMEEDESDNEEIDAILDSTKSALDSDGDYDYDDLDQLADEDDDELVGDGSDDGMEFPADMDDDDDDDEVADDKASDDDVSIGDADDGNEDEEDVFEVLPKKRKLRGKSGASPFASLEDYEHLMDDNENEDEDDNDDVKDSKKHKKSKKTKRSKHEDDDDDDKDSKKHKKSKKIKRSKSKKKKASKE